MLPDFQNAIFNVVLLWMLTTPHEFAHAWVAERLGDDTPRLDGRVTLNPLAHVDWIGTVILPLVTSLLGGVAPAFASFARHGVWLSLYLALFNMLPVPPLDGSKLLLAARIPIAIYNELARFGFMLVIVAMTASNLGRYMSLWSYLGADTIFAVFR